MGLGLWQHLLPGEQEIRTGYAYVQLAESPWTWGHDDPTGGPGSFAPEGQTTLALVVTIIYLDRIG